MASSSPMRIPAMTFMLAPSLRSCVPPARGMARHLTTPFQLNRCMVYSGLLPEQLLDRRQHLRAAALGRSADVHTGRMQAGGQSPAVQVVKLLHTGQAQDLLPQRGKIDLSWRPFEQDVGGLPEQPGRARQDEEG